MSEERPIWVRGADYDGSPHWVHRAFLLHEESGLLVTRTDAGTQVSTAQGGAWVSTFNTRGHYWPDRWYNVIRLETREGFTGYYCNVATPARFDGETLSYVDLQLDVRVYAEERGWRHEVVDEDEFLEARERYAYPEELVLNCYRAVEELLSLIEARRFPFEG